MTRPARAKRTASSTIADDHVIVGVIVGAWGLRGDVKVDLQTDYPERFLPGNVVYLDAEPRAILRARGHKAGRVIGLEGILDRTAAERLRGAALTIPYSELPELDSGSFFYFDIIDISVRTTTGDDLGRVEEIVATAGGDVYVIRGSGTILIPAVKEYVVDVDVEQGVMTVSLPEGYFVDPRM